MNRGGLTVLLAGWIAQSLAAPDSDVEAGIEAYDAGDFEAARVSFEAAIARRGPQPELELDRGLALLALEGQQDAQKAFEHATESDLASVRASGFYELGNLAFDAEDWPTAIAHYIDCLEARPDHANAKWNLELAQQRQREQEKQDEEDEQDEDESDEDKQEEDEQDEDEQEEDEQEEDEQEEDKSDEDKQEEDKSDEDKPDEDEPDEDKPDEDEPDEDKSDEGKPEEPKPEEPKPEEPQPDESKPDQPPPPSQLDELDMDKVLQQLDEQDDFVLGRPLGRPRAPIKDW